MKKVFWSKCKMFRNLHSFHGAFVCSDTYLRATPYLRGTFLSARHFPICEALSYLRGTSLSAKQPLSASYPLSARHFPILEPPPICEQHPYLRATLYLWVTSLSGSHPLSASHFPICEPPTICESLPYLGATPSLHYLGEPQFWLLSSTDMTELDFSDVSRNLCSYHLGTFLGSRSELQ